MRAGTRLQQLSGCLDSNFRARLSQLCILTHVRMRIGSNYGQGGRAVTVMTPLFGWLLCLSIGAGVVDVSTRGPQKGDPGRYSGQGE